MRYSICLLLAHFSLLQTAPAQSSSQPPLPIDATVNLPTLKIGTDDLVSIHVYDAPELTETARVDPQGKIHLPMIRQGIQAAGLLPSELEAEIGAALKDGKILVDPIVTVTIAEYRSRPVSVTGAVRRPITFQAVGDVTLLDAINRAEGLTPTAGPEILVSNASDGKTSEHRLLQRVPVRGLIDRANPALNLKLFGGEEIRIPEAGRVYVVGNVKRPGVFPVQDQEGTTVLKLLAFSEGLLPFASKQAFIYRPRDEDPSKREIPIDLNRIMSRKSPDVSLASDDILYIPDDHGKRMTAGVLEKLLTIGAVSSSALIYTGLR